MALNPGRTALRAFTNAASALSLSKTRQVVERANTGQFAASNLDIGKVITLGQGINNIFVPNSVFGVGDFVMFYNNTNSVITLTQNSGVTIYLANISNTQGAANVGNRNVASRGFCTLTSVAPNTFVVTAGVGVS